MIRGVGSTGRTRRFVGSRERTAFRNDEIRDRVWHSPAGEGVIEP